VWLVRTDVSEERIPITRADVIGELGTMWPVNINVVPSSLILFTLMMEAFLFCLFALSILVLSIFAFFLHIPLCLLLNLRVIFLG
jgi:hypothetical protein